MKNNDHKSLVKTARKAAAADIEQSVLKALKSAASKLKQESEIFAKAIEKGAKKLAKKLSKEIEFEKEVLSLEVLKDAKAEEKNPMAKTKTKAAAATGTIVTPAKKPAAKPAEAAPAAVEKNIAAKASVKPGKK